MHPGLDRPRVFGERSSEAGYTFLVCNLERFVFIERLVFKTDEKTRVVLMTEVKRVWIVVSKSIVHTRYENKCC